MKKMKWILIIAAVLIVLGIVFLIVKPGDEAPGVKPGAEAPGAVLDGDGMINPTAVSKFSYYCGGGMENGHYRVTLEADELTVERRTGEKTARKKYTVPDETIAEIENVLFASGMKEWRGEFPTSEYFALDADTVSVSIDYYDGAHISFNSNQEVPGEGWDSVNETMRLLEAIADK